MTALAPVTGRRPHPHQGEAVDALVTTLRANGRAQLTMACGTGKTLIGRWLAERMHSRLTLVVVPSLSLVAQTLQEWRSATGWDFVALITCSDPSTAAGTAERAAGDDQDVADSFWASQYAKVTRSPDIVEAVLEEPRDQPVVIFSTYHSVGIVAAAARTVSASFDLLIADEAHHLAGRPSRGFRETFRVPAAARVFMTATQVVLAARDVTAGAAPAQDTFSMSDESVFGPVATCLDFADAIERDLLADYDVLIYESPGDTTPDPVTALLTAAAEGLNSVLSFHGRVAKARAFAAAVDGLRLPDGRTVVARSVAGVDPTAQRAAALALLATPPAGQLIVVSSARCLAEGVDIPAVDGVLFADPRNGDVDIVQAVGRALRKAPGKQRGTVLIPVCVPAGLDDDTVLSTGSFAAAWRILRGLRAMDRRLAVEMDAVARRPERDRATADLTRIRFQVLSGPDRAALIARTVDATTTVWDRKLAELELFAAAHGHTRPGRGSDLGRWCERQRLAYRRKMLEPLRVHRLMAVPGWTWNATDERWALQLAQIAALAADRGGLDLDAPEVARTRLAGAEAHTGITTVGRWCALQRILARQGELDEWRTRQLDAVSGWSWQIIPGTDADHVDALREFVAWEKHANVPADHREDGYALGGWLNQLRRQHATQRLAQPVIDEVEVACARAAAGGALRWYHDETLWLLGVEALRQFATRTGHCRVPYHHLEFLPDHEVNLSVWCTRQRFLHRHGTLADSRTRILEAIPGWQWEHPPAPRQIRDIGETPHGTRTGYVKGCHCHDCTAANRADHAARARRAAAGEPTTDLVEAGRTRARLRLLHGRGASINLLAQACHLNKKAVTGLISGETRRVLPSTEQTVLALRLDDVWKAAPPNTKIPAGPTWLLLDDMIDRGWPKSWLARELGFAAALQLQRDWVTARNAARVRELDQRLGRRRPPSYRPLPALDALLAAETTDPQLDRHPRTECA
ncbi:helicase associated domain-containing protein [Nocardia sp. IFM 10818]